jgi:NADH:ubiquinone reductase (non-electrogenic)
MKIAAATLVLALATLLLACHYEACDNVPTMYMDDMCHKACPHLYELCRKTLEHGADAAEVTVYAIVAAKYAKLSYQSTMEKLDQLLQAASGDERAAYSRCKDSYYEALSPMSYVVTDLFTCSFSATKQRYLNATAAVAACRDDLRAFQSSPLYPMIAADQDRTMLAFNLGGLIVGKQLAKNSAG